MMCCFSILRLTFICSYLYNHLIIYTSIPAACFRRSSFCSFRVGEDSLLPPQSTSKMPLQKILKKVLSWKLATLSATVSPKAVGFLKKINPKTAFHVIPHIEGYPKSFRMQILNTSLCILIQPKLIGNFKLLVLLSKILR